MTEHKTDAGTPTAEAGSFDAKLVYEAPMLHARGDVRDLTLGASIGAIETGNTRTFRR